MDYNRINLHLRVYGWLECVCEITFELVIVGIFHSEILLGVASRSLVDVHPIDRLCFDFFKTVHVNNTQSCG